MTVAGMVEVSFPTKKKRSLGTAGWSWSNWLTVLVHETELKTNPKEVCLDDVICCGRLGWYRDLDICGIADMLNQNLKEENGQKRNDRKSPEHYGGFSKCRTSMPVI
jgi:hypothetical protein